jgi:hypothetical protein
MNITELKKHVETIGCKVTRSTPFSLIAECGDGITIIKEPESRLKIFVKMEGIDKISAFMPEPSVTPRDMTIGKFDKQGPWSKIIKFGNLDEVEYVYGEDEMRKSGIPVVQKSINRIDRANKFAYMNSQGGVDPFNVVKNEVDSMSGLLTREIEDGIASITGNDVICGGKNLIQKSWTTEENEKYRYMIKINCKVPSILSPVTEKLENIGTWKTMSESDRFYIKSVVPPFKDVFVTGIKIKSPVGNDLVEFEAVDESIVKKKDFLKKVATLKVDGIFKVTADDFPVETDGLLSTLHDEKSAR